MAVLEQKKCVQLEYLCFLHVIFVLLCIHPRCPKVKKYGLTYKVFGILSEFTFKKTERLKSKKAIAGLFSKENNVSFVAYPFKVVWMPAEDVLEYPVQVAISVPKRVFKTAVQRNVLKRRTREAWRLNKMVFYSTLEESNLKIVMMLVYIAKEELSFQEIERGIKKVCYKFEPPKK